MLMLTAYMDESGHSADPRSRYVGIGGLIAEEKAWERFESEWSTALADAGIHGGFHMKDFAHRMGHYQGWDEAKRRSLLGRLVDAIVNAKATPVGCVVSLDDYNAAPPDLQRFYQDPYYMAFQHATRGAALQALPKDYPYTPETVAMIYAYQSEFGATEAKAEYDERQAGRAQQLWHAMKELTMEGQWMGSYGSAYAADLYPLQAADLFAYELTKEFENLVSRPQDNMRWALRKILALNEYGTPLIQFYDSHEMLRIFIEASGQDRNASDQINDLLTVSWLKKTAIRDRMLQRMKHGK
jgi:hypothetical protein